MANGAIIYEGPSAINGEPIVAIATGFLGGGSISSNSKTGPMVQVWIISANEHPFEASENGNDKAICGECPLKKMNSVNPGKRSCYVGLYYVAKIYQAYKKGNYFFATPEEFQNKLNFGGMKMGVRFGAYGDPAAIPYGILQQYVNVSSKWTAYTHSWKKFPELKNICMASCDTQQDRIEANSLGFRTFSVANEAVSGSINCPASIESGHKTTCSDCNLCDGSKSEKDNRKNIWIKPHGITKKNFVNA